MKLLWIIQYLRGEFLCRFIHKPLFFGIGGFGGIDIFGRRRKSYHEYRCVKCGLSWESEREPKWNKLPYEEKWIISEKIKEIDRG